MRPLPLFSLGQKVCFKNNDIRDELISFYHRMPSTFSIGWIVGCERYNDDNNYYTANYFYFVTWAGGKKYVPPRNGYETIFLGSRLLLKQFNLIIVQEYNLQLCPAGLPNEVVL